MISNFDIRTKQFLSITSEMIETHHQFYLTGSRFFGGAADSSDWDFFVENSAEIDYWLRTHEFIPETETDYDDSNLLIASQAAAVWIHPARIHVQIVIDAKKKNIVQNAIAVGFSSTFSKMPKSNQRQIWNLAYYIYEAAGRK